MTLARPLHPVHPLARPNTLRAAALAGLTTLLAACGGGGDDADTPPVVAQPVLSTLNAAGSGGSYEARTSMAPTNGADASSMFDDFQPTAAVSIASVKWQGIYCVQAANAAAPAATATEFVVSFHADDAGRPVTSSALLQARFTPTQAAQTPGPPGGRAELRHGSQHHVVAVRLQRDLAHAVCGGGRHPLLGACAGGDAVV
jgi:hypothetical protein